VDDDLPICEILELALADEGWDVRVRTRGQAALDLLQRWMADVILLDLRMPEMDAEAFLSRCRSQIARDIPILLLSASSNLDHHAERLGVDAVMAKPFDIDTLCMAVQQVVAQHHVGSVVSGGSRWSSNVSA